MRFISVVIFGAAISCANNASPKKDENIALEPRVLTGYACQTWIDKVSPLCLSYPDLPKEKALLLAKKQCLSDKNNEWYTHDCLFQKKQNSCRYLWEDSEVNAFGIGTEQECDDKSGVFEAADGP